MRSDQHVVFQDMLTILVARPNAFPNGHFGVAAVLAREVSLVPLVVGAVAPEKVAEVLEQLWGGDETLFVISSDLSHYHSYEAARRIDGATVQAILGFDAGISHAGWLNGGSRTQAVAPPGKYPSELARMFGQAPELCDMIRR